MKKYEIYVLMNKEKKNSEELKSVNLEEKIQNRDCLMIKKQFLGNYNNYNNNVYTVFCLETKDIKSIEQNIIFLKKTKIINRFLIIQVKQFQKNYNFNKTTDKNHFLNIKTLQQCLNSFNFLKKKFELNNNNKIQKLIAKNVMYAKIMQLISYV